jgi:hypothetical protein
MMSTRTFPSERQSTRSSTTTPLTSNPKLRKWLAQHPRWTFHFTPTSASWLNAIEGFFAKLTYRRLKRGVFRSVAELQVAIDRFIAETNADLKPFVWIAPPSRIVGSKRWSHSTSLANAARSRHSRQRWRASRETYSLLR